MQLTDLIKITIKLNQGFLIDLVKQKGDEAVKIIETADWFKV